MDSRCGDGDPDGLLSGPTRERFDSRACLGLVGSGDEDTSGTDGTSDGGRRDCECGSVVVYSGHAGRRERMLSLSWEADSAW